MQMHSLVEWLKFEAGEKLDYRSSTEFLGKSKTQFRYINN